MHGQIADGTPLPARPNRLAAFERLGYGLFLHYGLYSQKRAGEWLWHHHQIERDEYLKLFDSFDPSGFDAPALVAMAQDAGFRYICLTTRHHEGFSLYDTRGLNEYHAPSVCGRDLVAEFSEACDAAGMGKFFYHTTLDWWHPDFDREGGWDAYQQYLRDSVAVLCQHYGTVDGLWFDGNWARQDRDWQEDQLYGLIRQHQPDCVIVNNSSIGAVGAEGGHPETDVVTFEQGIPVKRDQRGAARYRSGEMCETMNSHWGVGDFDLSYKSPADVVERLTACRSVGANLLLNIGPAADGSIPDYETEVMRLVGRWTRICPEAIYDAEPTSLTCRGRDAVVKAGGTYYYFCHAVAIRGNGHLAGSERGDGLQTIAGDLPAVRRIAWADEPDTDLDFSQADGHLVFDATPHPYGRQLVVRIAVIETE